MLANVKQNQLKTVRYNVLEYINKMQSIAKNPEYCLSVEWTQIYWELFLSTSSVQMGGIDDRESKKKHQNFIVNICTENTEQSEREWSLDRDRCAVNVSARRHSCVEAEASSWECICERSRRTPEGTVRSHAQPVISAQHSQISNTVLYFMSIKYKCSKSIKLFQKVTWPKIHIGIF